MKLVCPNRFLIISPGRAFFPVDLAGKIHDDGQDDEKTDIDQ